jgi:hypothetical protein
MKKSIAFTVLFTIVFCSVGQNLIQENKLWNVVECLNFGPCITQTFMVMGDTAIGQFDYKKVYYTYNTTLTNWVIFCATRETEDQVFLYNFYTETEQLLYDFNLVPGDTFVSIISNPSFSCQVELMLISIDTVTLTNGEQKRRFIFDEDVWIESVGSLIGLFYVGVYQCIIDMWFDLSCCHLNDELIYKSPAYPSCYVNTVGVPEQDHQPKHIVYPNPFSQAAVFEFDYLPCKNYRLQIINVNGQVVSDISDINSGKVLINGGPLLPGIYFYRLMNEDNVIGSGKFIKTD